MSTILKYTLLAAIFLQVCDGNVQQMQAFRHVLAQRCDKYSTNATISRELLKQVDELIGKVQTKSNFGSSNSYGQSNSFDPEQFSANPDELCADRGEVKEQMDKALPLLTECLSKEEKYLPSFVREAIIGFMNFSCENNGENLKKLMSPQSKQCGERFQKQNSPAAADLGGCILEIMETHKSTTSANTETFIEKDKLCEDIDMMKKCLKKALRKHCSNDDSLPSLSDKLFESVSQPCAGCLLMSNVALLVVLASFIVKFFY